MVYHRALWLLMFLCCMGRFQRGAANICCTPDQFEADFIYDNWNCFIDADTAYSYMNASVQAAYDYVNQRAFLKLDGVQLSPLVPGPQTYQVTYINDFKTGMQYAFDSKQCKKDRLGPMTKQCIPAGVPLSVITAHVTLFPAFLLPTDSKFAQEDGANLTSSGYIGNKETGVQTYKYTLKDSPFLFTATVTTGDTECVPVNLFYMTVGGEQGSGTINGLQISNFKKGIHDTSIFTPPSSCDASGLNFQKENRHKRSSRYLSLFQLFF